MKNSEDSSKQQEETASTETAEALVWVQIVTHNDRHTIEKCVQSVIDQEGFEVGKNLQICAIDNNSQDDTAKVLNHAFKSSLLIRENSINTGFTGAHNKGIHEALSAGAKYVFLFNPDARLAPTALKELVGALEEDPRSAMACPKLLRCDKQLNPLSPGIIDSSGMWMSPTIRHFDRGSGERDCEQYEKQEYVFGASGAAVLFRREFILDAQLHCSWRTESIELFDQAFFAYREDADLSWRAQILGWKCLYVPQALGYHLRVVVPERRSVLPKEVNAYSVKNRFLLQGNNLSLATNIGCIPSLFYRNLLVLAAVLTREQSSIPAIRSAWSLVPSILRHRKTIFQKKRCELSELSRWFRRNPHSEPARRPKHSNHAISSLLLVIVNYNSGNRLSNCLLSLVPEIYELIEKLDITLRVVDNASSDDSAKRAEPLFKQSPNVEFIFSETNLGFSGAINLAAKDHSADAVLILNPDAEIAAKDLLLLIQALERYSDIGVIAPRLCNKDGSPQLGFNARTFPTVASTLAELFFLHRIAPNNRWTSRYLMTSDKFFTRYLNLERFDTAQPYDPPEKPFLVSQPAGACLLVRRPAFNAVAGFDESFWPAWFEDVDFCKRLSDIGVHSAVLAKAKAVHEGGYSRDTLSPGTFYAIWYPNLIHYWKKHGTTLEYLLIRGLLPMGLALRSMIHLLFAGIDRLRKKKDWKKRLSEASTLLRLAVKPKPLTKSKSPDLLFPEEKRNESENDNRFVANALN